MYTPSRDKKQVRKAVQIGVARARKDWLWRRERCVEDTELRVALHKVADGNAYIVLAFESADTRMKASE